MCTQCRHGDVRQARRRVAAESPLAGASDERTTRASDERTTRAVGRSADGSRSTLTRPVGLAPADPTCAINPANLGFAAPLRVQVDACAPLACNTRRVNFRRTLMICMAIFVAFVWIGGATALASGGS